MIQPFRTFASMVHIFMRSFWLQINLKISRYVSVHFFQVYTVGPYFAYAETRKSPTVDGVVRRNASGKELREGTTLSPTEQEIARRICMAFGQTICGFDMVRVDGRSYVIDVNGWSFVKGSSYYYDACASILTHTFMRAAAALPLKYPSIHEHSMSIRPSSPGSRSWRLKTYISCIRHADRTPKQKLKFVLPANDLFKAFGRSEFYTDQQLILREPSDLQKLYLVVSEMILALSNNDPSQQQFDHLISQLRPLQSLIEVRLGHADTKVQIRFLSDSLSLLVVKWGGEFTHSGWHQAQEFGESLRADLKILNKSLLADIRIFSSEERRVKATAVITAKALLHLAKLPSGLIANAPDLLDDNLEAKDEMESVKAYIGQYLSEPFQNDLETINPYASDLAKDPSSFISQLTDLLNVHYLQFINTSPTDLTSHKWCCLDSNVLWRERWLKIFKDVLPLNNSGQSTAVLPLQTEPGRICEVYDSLKYDELHNRAFLDYFFLGISPSPELRHSLHELFIRTKTLYNWVSISEYGISLTEKLSIGKKIIRKLLSKLIDDLKESTLPSTVPSCRLYFTKESHMYPLLNVIQYGKLSAWTSKPYSQWELDYLSQITFEIYERYPSDELGGIQAEHSVRISLSQGGYNPSIIDVNLDEKHCLSVVPREWITEYFPLDKAIEALQ